LVAEEQATIDSHELNSLVDSVGVGSEAEWLALTRLEPPEQHVDRIQQRYSVGIWVELIGCYRLTFPLLSCCSATYHDRNCDEIVQAISP